MMNNYGTPPLALVRGVGAEVWDDRGRRYLDLLAGIAVNSLGHAHPAIVEAVTTQLCTLGHTSNLYLTEPSIELAERLIDLLGVPHARALFCNSGTEAVEAAFKLSRRTGRTKLVACEGAFHGRTMGGWPVSASAPIVRPWKASSAAMMWGRPVRRAILNAASLASAPELQKSTRPGQPSSSSSRSASASGGSVM